MQVIEAPNSSDAAGVCAEWNLPIWTPKCENQSALEIVYESYIPIIL